MKTFHITTFGCQMNIADSSTLASLLLTRGYKRVKTETEADLLIINTCSVRVKAEQRVIGRLGDFLKYKVKNPLVKIAVVGCMAQRMGEDLIKKVPHVDFVIGTDRLYDLPDAMEGTEGTSSVMTAFGHENIDLIEPVKDNDFSAFVTISRGCDNFCSYCIVPYVRGRERAHSDDFIIESVKKLVGQGVVEITLLGQNVNSYNYNKTDFPKLLRRVSKETAIPRIRFMTSHPKDLSRSLVDVITEDEKVMPHIHLPLQSGSNRILKKMGRLYTVEHYLEIVEYIKSRSRDISLTTDLIVGFPTETENEYEETLKVVRQVNYDAAFMFRYSIRPGTKAADFFDDVPENDKIRRLKKLIALQQQISYECNQRETGKIRNGLVEGTSRRNKTDLRARTENNKIVIFKMDNCEPGKVLPIKINSADAFTLHGEMMVS